MQVFRYNGKEITFDFGDGVKMVNATEMAKVFNKTPYEFVRLPQTSRFITALSNTGLSRNTITRSIRGNSEHSGTWMHEKLALKFAAWLSPEFELWVYDCIRELLTTGTVSLPNFNNPAEAARAWADEHEAKEISEKARLAEKARADQAEQKLIKQEPKVKYYDSVLNSKDTMTTTQVAKGLGLSSATKLNKILNRFDVQYKQSGQWLLYSCYSEKGYTKTKTTNFKMQDGTTGCSHSTVWTQKGREFIFLLLVRKGVIKL